jgi:Holliday junction resolvasome RuvABC endonuclease subunit
MSVATLLVQSTQEDVMPVRRPTLTGHGPGTSPSAVLAPDLGQKPGRAVRNTDGEIASNTVEFKPSRWEGGGTIYLRFHACLQELDETASGVDAVYFEEVRSHRGVVAAHAYGGFLAHLTAWAEANKIPYAGVPVGMIKRHVTGRGNADNDVVAAVRALDFDPADDQADAIALLHWALKTGGPR